MIHHERTRYRSIPLILVLVLAVPAMAVAEPSDGFDHDHGTFDALLGRYVKQGEVDYAGWKSGGSADLDRYLSSLASVSKSQYRSWNSRQKLAFWINTYNAATIDKVLEHHPISSIMELGSKRGAAFDQRFVPVGHLHRGSSKLSLNQIENEIIRRQFRDPRFHFALVCAATSCPPLRSEAYTPSALNRQLSQQTRGFINDRSANRYDAGSHTLYLSRIFQWYGEDFQHGDSTVASFVGRYLGGEAEQAIESQPPEIQYLDYDWSLNDR